MKIYHKYSKSIDLLINWGYEVCINNENDNDNSEEYIMWSAQKDGNIYHEKDPLRLLGVIVLSKEYCQEEQYNDNDEVYFESQNYLLKPQKNNF